MSFQPGSAFKLSTSSALSLDLNLPCGRHTTTCPPIWHARALHPAHVCGTAAEATVAPLGTGQDPCPSHPQGSTHPRRWCALWDPRCTKHAGMLAVPIIAFRFSACIAMHSPGLTRAASGIRTARHCNSLAFSPYSGAAHMPPTQCPHATHLQLM